MDIFPATVTPIVEFISQKFLEGKQYSTLNSLRSALSVTIPPIEGQPVLVCRALQGSFNQRPPMPRYSSTWDVNTVIQYMKEKMGNNLELNLKELTLKLTVLLALSNATRASYLVALDVRFMQSTAVGITFRIPKLTKTRRSGAPKSIPVAWFEDLKLCPVHTINCYICQTKDLKRPGSEGSNPLLISFRKPHNPVSTTTVARWMKEVLSLAGIDTETFSAHSSTQGQHLSQLRVNEGCPLSR